MSEVKVYLKLDQDLKEDLESADRATIIEALEGVAEAATKKDEDELSQYETEQEIQQDDSLSNVEKKQLKIKSRITGFPRV